MKMETLENFVDITSGQIMSRITAKENETPVCSRKVVIPKVITSDGFLLNDEMPIENLKIDASDERITQVNDIVIKLSTPFDSSIITPNDVGCVIPSFCAKIRNRGELDLNYLCAFLASKYCKDQLKAKVSGAVMSILTIGKIQSLLIPVPPKHEQKRIGEEFIKSRKNILLMKQITELENKRNDIIFQELQK